MSDALQSTVYDYDSVKGYIDSGRAVSLLKAERILITTLLKIAEGIHLTDPMLSNDDPLVISTLAAGLLENVARLLASPLYIVMQHRHHTFCLVKPAFDAIFGLISAKNPPFLHGIIQENADQVGEDQLILKHLIALTTDSSATFGEDWGMTLFDPAFQAAHFPAYLGLLQHMGYTTQRADDFINTMLDNVSYNDPEGLVAVSDSVQPYELNRPWHHVRACLPHRTAKVRGELNEIYRAWLKKGGLECDASLTLTDKPRFKVGVVAGSLLPHTEAYLWRMNALISLCEYADVTLICDSETYFHPEMHQIFDGELIEVETDKLIDGIQAVQDLAPDMLLFPQINETLISQIFTQIRIAPIQVAFASGNRSSSAKHLDYIIITDDMYDPQADLSAYTEKLIVLPNMPLDLRPDEDAEVQIEAKHDDGQLHIAVLGPAKRYLPSMITRLQETISQLDRDCTLHFFTDTIEIIHLRYETQLREHFPDCRIQVYRQMPQNEYTAALSRCHMAISGFPVEQLKTLVQAAQVGTPIFSLTGDQPVSRVTYHFHQKTGTSQCCTDQPEQFAEMIKGQLDELEALGQAFKTAVESLFTDATTAKAPEFLNRLAREHARFTSENQPIVMIEQDAVKPVTAG